MDYFLAREGGGATIERMKNMCQSCGMPLAKDPEGGGTNADGTKSQLYCSYCFDNGAFRDSCTDAKEFQKLVRKKMRESGMNRVLAWFLTLGIPRLGRWNRET